MKLTKTKKEVLEFYCKYINKNSIAPTYLIASIKLGISPSNVFFHVESLVKHDYLTKDETGIDIGEFSPIERKPLLNRVKELEMKIEFLMKQKSSEECGHNGDEISYWPLSVAYIISKQDKKANID